MDTSSFLRVSIWLIAVREATLAQLYSAIPLHVLNVPSPYPWSSLRNSETPLGRKLITYSDYPSEYPTDILVQSNSIYYSPNSNAHPRNYFLPNPVPGKSPIIFQPTSLHRHPIPIRVVSRVGNSLRSSDQAPSRRETTKDSRRAGFIVDNSIGGNTAAQTSESVRVWESKQVPVKPFPFQVYDTAQEQPKATEAAAKWESSTTTKPEVTDAKTGSPNAESEEVAAPAESPAVGFVTQEPQQFYKKEKNGRVIFGFHTKEQTRMESRDADAKVYGAYTYFDPTGNPVRMQYWDEGKGFHAAGNMLPQNVLPQSVTDTPEVQAARKLHHKLPVDNGIHSAGPPSSVLPPLEPSSPTLTEEDDDEVIIDSQKLPDNDYATSDMDSSVSDKEPTPSAINFNNAKNSIPNTAVTEDKTEDPEARDDSDSIVVENLELRKVKRSIEEPRSARHHNFFEHPFTKHTPFPQFPLFPAYPFIPPTRVFTPPPHFHPSPLETDHRVPGKFAPMKTDLKSKSATKTNSVTESTTKPPSPFSDVAHKFVALLHAKTQTPSPAEVDDFPTYAHEEFTRVFLDHPEDPASPTGYADEPLPWLSAPSAPEAHQEDSLPTKPHLKPGFLGHNVNSFPPTKFSEVPSDFHVKPDLKKGDFYGSSPLFTSFAAFPYPQSSQSFIQTEPHGFKYSSGYFPKPPVSYHVTHFDDQFHFPSAGSQLPFSRPFIGHDYTLVDKDFPSSNPHIYFPYVPPFSTFPDEDHFSSFNNHDLPSIEGFGSPASSPKPSGDAGSNTTEKGTKRKEAAVNSEQTTTESSGLKIVVADVPTNPNQKENSDGTGSSGSGSSSVGSTENETGSTESNESGETTESNEKWTVGETPMSNVASLTNEEEKSDSSLVSDGRLTAEESTSIIQPITESQTEAATESTEPSRNELDKSVTPGYTAPGEGGFLNEVPKETAEEKGESYKETVTNVPEEIGDASNIVRRNAAVSVVNPLGMMEIHDVQVSPKQRLVNFRISPVVAD